MNSDLAQARNESLNGTVAFPMPFPTLGRISFEVGEATNSTMPELAGKDVLVLEEVRNEASVRQIVLRDKVTAVFVPGARDDQQAFHMSESAYALDLEAGEWFFGTEISTDSLRCRLNLHDRDDVSTRRSVLRGIVFIGESTPVLSVTEVGLSAGNIDFERRMPRAVSCTRC